MRLYKLAFSLSLWVEPHLWVSEQRAVSGTEKFRDAIILNHMFFFRCLILENVLNQSGRFICRVFLL